MSSEGQRIVQELDTSVDDLPGRHRAPASVVRKVSVRLAIAAVAVLAVTGLGMATADVLGLSDTGWAAADGKPLQAVPSDRAAEPRPYATVDLSAPPALPPVMLQGEAPPADPSPQQPPAVAAAPAEEPASAPASPAPVRTVRTGDSCSTVGRTGVTGKGDTAVCTASPGNGPNKWRAA